MALKGLVGRVLLQPRLNVLLTNRIPRHRLTRLMGWFSKIEQPLVRKASIAAFRFFADDLNLHEARKTRFRSLHDCFVRELKEGARPVDPDPAVIVSPCDAIVAAAGEVCSSGQLVQAKGHRYALEDLLLDPELARACLHGGYVTLRLKANMYHRFHAPHDCRVTEVRHIPGDTWNVNPSTLQRVPKVYVRNERAVLRTTLTSSGHVVALVPVAAVLVASIRLHFIDTHWPRKKPRRRRMPPRVIPCNAPFQKGQEMGWFEHGSTMIVVVPRGIELAPNVHEGAVIRVGQPLLRLS
jgi:phosphatidylserine decarboxylase